MVQTLTAGRAARAVSRRVRHCATVAGFWLVIAGLLAIRRLIQIRLATFRSERMGHFISDTDLALALIPGLQARSKHPKSYIFVMPEAVCNEQVRAMYIRTIGATRGARILDCRNSLLGRLLLGPARTLTAHVQHDGRLREYFCGSLDPGGVDAVGFKPSGRPYLRHSDEEVLEATGALKALGLPEGMRYACIHIRDRAYLNAVLKQRDWSYHDYRNPPPESYVPAIEYLLNRGIAVVRMGRASESRIDIDHPLYFDYSRWDGRSDLLDTFLYSGAVLAVGGAASGIDNLALSFNVPYVCTNFVPFEDPRFAVDLSITIPSLIRDLNSGEFLPLSQMLSSRFFSSKRYAEAGLKIEYNTPGEILDAVQEAVLRISGDWVSDSEDDALQEKFWEWADLQGIAGRLPPGPWDVGHYRSLLGTSFLREHADLLLS